MREAVPLPWRMLFLTMFVISAAMLACARVNLGHAWDAAGGSPDEAGHRRLTSEPCWIHEGCYKGVYWHPGWDDMGTGWYCSDGAKVGKWTKFDKCHIKAPCRYGVAFAKHNTQWECAHENTTKTLERIEELLLKIKKGPHDSDRVWALKELDSELPAPQTQCPKRGWEAPKKCRMLGLEHGKMLLGASRSLVIFDMLTHKDNELRGHAIGILDGIVLDDKENLRRMSDLFGGTEGVFAKMNPASSEMENTREKAAVVVNLIANQCKETSPDMCSFFPLLAQMGSAGLGELVLHPPKVIGTNLQVALQEAWVSSCTGPINFPTNRDFKACGGSFLKKVPHVSSDKAYALLQSLHELLWKDLAKQIFRKDLFEAISPWLDDDNLPDNVKALGKSLLV